jgi:archaellum biogenesis ATPase FlaH
MIADMPHDRDIEATVLGDIIGGCLEPPKADEILSTLAYREDVFYSDSHRDMLIACIRLRKDGKPIDQIAVRDTLKAMKSKVEDVLILEVVVRANTITALSVDNNIAILDRMRQQREAIRALASALDDVSKPLADTDEIQALIAGTVSDLSDLQETAGAGRDGWPALTDQATIIEPPALPPFLVDGLLHQGEKMLLTGRAKAGKSLLLSQLALGVASGSEWLGMPCEKTSVLYVLLEGAQPFNDNRFYRIKDELGITLETGTLETLNLAGANYRLATFTDKLKAATRNRSYGLVIIDPLYMLNGGDENSAEHIRKLFYEIDRIAKHFNASVVTCHHQTKGNSSGKHVIDRASGSGVFGRYQDVGIDLIELDGSIAANVMSAKGILLPDNTTAWRLEAYCRNAASPPPLNIWRKGIVAEVDEYGALDDAKPLEVGTSNATERAEAKQAEHDAEITKAIHGLETVSPSVREIAEFLDVARRTVDGWLSRSQIFETYKPEGERGHHVRQITR